MGWEALIVLKAPFGGLSNRLFQHVHFDSFCRENGRRFINPFMDSFWLRFPKVLRQLRRVDALNFTNDSGDYSDHERLMIS